MRRFLPLLLALLGSSCSIPDTDAELIDAFGVYPPHDMAEKAVWSQIDSLATQDKNFKGRQSSIGDTDDVLVWYKDQNQVCLRIAHEAEANCYQISLDAPRAEAARASALQMAHR